MLAAFGAGVVVGIGATVGLLKLTMRTEPQTCITVLILLVLAGGGLVGGLLWLVLG